MQPDNGVDFFGQPNEYEEMSKDIDNSYIETYNAVKDLRKGDFSELAFIKTMVGFKTEQVACLIGDNLSDYDKKILAGVIERHIAGVIYKG